MIFERMVENQKPAQEKNQVTKDCVNGGQILWRKGSQIRQQIVPSLFKSTNNMAP